MSSIRRHPKSGFWYACFELPDGRRTQRSTGIPIGGVPKADVTALEKAFSDALNAKVEITVRDLPDGGGGINARDARRLAMKTAVFFEEAAREASAGRLTDTQARKTISDIVTATGRDNPASSSVKDFLSSWLKRKELEASEGTHERYTGAVGHVLRCLGGKAQRDITHLDAKEITRVRDRIADKLSANSANYTVRVLRAALNQARRDGLVDTNEASRVTTIKRSGERFERRPFKLPELKRILAVADDEWRGLILTGLYTGLRLGDVAALTWANVDLQNKAIVITTRKTGRTQDLPIAKPLLKHLEMLPAGDNPTAPLFPRAFETRERSPKASTLSNQFYALLVSAGLAPARTHESTRKGRDGRRNLSAISFHSLRHTATSLLKNAGVSDVVARDIIGHETEAISRTYTPIDQETKRAALDKMPDVAG